MEGKVVVLVLMLTVLGQANAVPTVTASNGPKFTVKTGDTVAMTCRVQNAGSAKVNWIYVKHNLMIFHGGERQARSNRYSLQQPDSTISTLLITDVNIADQGVYKCEVDGTNIAATFEIILSDSPVPPEADITPPALNRTGCCQQRGVSEACQPICAPASVEGNLGLQLVACSSELTNLLYCGADGRNHENCCARQTGFPSKCLVLCSTDPMKLPNITNTDLSSCLTYFPTIVSCYEYGGALIPSPPESVSVLSFEKNNQSELVISWKKPMYNPSAVLGYLVFYKKSSDAKFQTTELLGPSVLEYRLHAEVDVLYSIYVLAVGHHGSSQPSDTVEITAIKKSGGYNIDLCCSARRVPETCMNALCEPRVWETFNVNMMIDECNDFLPDVFTCLAGERNHTGCCNANHVPDECLPMCSGSPIKFNSSLLVCLPKLPVIEACIQQGLATQPEAPDGVSVDSVMAHSAEVTWAEPSVSGLDPVDSYHVQLRRGGEKADWMSALQVFGTTAELTNLTESENYAVRVISQVGNTSSLPSATIRFTTPPATNPPFRPTVDHNLTKCCEDSGMPAVCSAGCIYTPYMTKYYAGVLETCKFYIGSVLTCAADGRNHIPCCQERDVKEICYGMCLLNSPGPLNPQYLACLNDTAKIVTCFSEGIADLVRMPEDVMVINLTSHTITLQWNNPETGPRPDHYEVKYTSDELSLQKTTTELVMVLQNLKPNTKYSITITSFLNVSSSPPTQVVEATTPGLGMDSPFIPSLPTNISRALWSSRTDCCMRSGIREECLPQCLNQPTTVANCSSENQKILACAADGQDHSTCCREEGLVEECVSLCSGRAASSFSVRQAGCLAAGSLSIITSCFFSNSGLLPAMPRNFTVVNGNREVTLTWADAERCGSACSYDVHYWRANTEDSSDYTTVTDVTSPHVLNTGLEIGGKYTFTVTARIVNGSGPAAPWQTLFFGILSPDIFIRQRPDSTIYDQGTNVTYICEILNFPHQMTFTWHHRGTDLDTRGSVLLVDKVDRRKEGNYTCMASILDYMLQATTYLNVRYIPKYVSHEINSVSPDVGAEAVLEFRFIGHPLTSDLSVVWTKDGNSIQQSNRYLLSTQTLLQTGLTIFKLKIVNVVSSDYGSYRCQVANQFGSAVAVSMLMDPAQAPTPLPPSPAQKRNITKCCEANNIPDLCMPICRREVRIEEAVNKPDKYGYCLFYFDEFIECAADGADHTLCCEKESVQGDCLPLCTGRVPPTDDITNAPHLLKCVPQSETILQCMETGFEKIPTAPLDVSAEVNGNMISVTWTRPARNAEHVTSYTLYYNYTGRPEAETETITNPVESSHVLKNMAGGRTYNIWMTAESQFVGRSQPSALLSVSIQGAEASSDKMSAGAIAGIVIGVLALIVIIVVVVYLVRRRGIGQQKFGESVTYNNSGNDMKAVINSGYENF